MKLSLLVKYFFLLTTDLRLLDALKYFWKIWTCQFKLIGSGNCNHFILSFCWEIKEPNIKHKLLLSGSCKNVDTVSFFIKIKKFPFCLSNIRLLCKVDWLMLHSRVEQLLKKVSKNLKYLSCDCHWMCFSIINRLLAILSLIDSENQMKSHNLKKLKLVKY